MHVIPLLSEYNNVTIIIIKMHYFEQTFHIIGNSGLDGTVI
jgi:hypothetical protein